MNLSFTPEELGAKVNDIEIEYSHCAPGNTLIFNVFRYDVEPDCSLGTAHGIFWFRNQEHKVHLATALPGSSVVAAAIRLREPFDPECYDAPAMRDLLESIAVPAIAGPGSAEVSVVKHTPSKN